MGQPRSHERARERHAARSRDTEAAPLLPEGFVRPLRCAAVLLSAWLAPVAAAAPGPQDTAEATRLAEDMSKLAERGFWKGVDRRYVELVALQAATGVAVSSEDHLTGADAARNLGLIDHLLERLQRAAAAGAPVDEAIARVQRRFGWVEVAIESRGAEVPLELAREPFELDARQALQSAREQLEQERRFSGHLPVGEYTLGPETFEVRSGDEPARVSIGGRGRPIAQPPPASRPPADPGAARLLVRLAAGAAGAGWALDGLQPVAATGFAPSAAVGGRVPLGETLGLQAELGWAGLMGRGRTSKGGASYNLGVGQLALTGAWSGWRFTGGPAYGFGAGRVQGLDEQAVVAGCDTDACSDTGQLGRVETTDHWLRGDVAGPGAAVSVARELENGGPVSTAVGLRLTGLTDGDRFYTFGQVELTFGLALGDR